MDLAADEAFELKLMFLRELGAGHTEATAALERLRQNADDAQAIQDLRGFFHKIAGTAEPVDFPVLGRLAAACEAAADALIDGSMKMSRKAMQIFADGLGGVSSVLEGQAVTPAAARAEPEVAPASPGPLSAPSRILVVDDDPFSARLVDSLLRQAGFQSSFCCEPQNAFDVILAENPDLIVLDVVMPALDGFDLCRRVRSHPGLQLTPIIFVTRKGDVEQRVRGLEVGGNDYVAKPFEPQELVARVRSHLQHLAELREMAIRDGLTRCYNSKYFKARLEQEVARAQRYGSALTLALLDLDHFKQINDSHGHPAGDAVLSHLASILTASVRSTDVVARYGGEEFAILLVEAAAHEATIITNRLRERVSRHGFEVPTNAGESMSIHCTVSIGLATTRRDETHEALLHRADEALYAAKDGGRNLVRVAD